MIGNFFLHIYKVIFLSLLHGWSLGLKNEITCVFGTAGFGFNEVAQQQIKLSRILELLYEPQFE